MHAFNPITIMNYKTKSDETVLEEYFWNVFTTEQNVEKSYEATLSHCTETNKTYCAVVSNSILMKNKYSKSC